MYATLMCGYKKHLKELKNNNNVSKTILRFEMLYGLNGELVFM